MDLKKERERIPYQEAIGNLLYATQISCPDINYAVNACNRYSNNPRISHWNAVKQIFRYLQGISDAKLIFRKSRSYKQLIGYYDSDWSNNLDDRRSVTGYVVQAFDNLVSWNTKRQSTVTLSTMPKPSICYWVQKSRRHRGSELAPGLLHSVGQMAQSLHKELNLDMFEIKIYSDNKSVIDFDDYR